MLFVESDGGYEGLGYVRDVAPPDVASTVDWLLASGFSVAALSGGRRAPFGNVLVKFDGGDLDVEVLLERSRWLLTFELSGGMRSSLDAVLLAMGEVLPEQPEVLPYSVRQVPPDVPWRESLPRAVAWLRGADRTAQIVAVHNEIERRWHERRG